MTSPLANGEPATLMDAIERHAGSLVGCRVHQMHALRNRPYLHAQFGDRLRHISYFLSHVTRPCFQAGTLDLVPNNFSEMRAILHTATTEADYPLIEEAPPLMSDADHRIASLVAERIHDGSTLQIGIGGIPNAILAALVGHRDLGVHTELISDGVMNLVELGVVTGVAKQLNRTKAVGTFALGTRELYDFLDKNAAFELWPVRYVNDPRVIAQESGFVSINASIAVDLLGQCASETVAGAYYSSSGGQADFARGAMYSPGGQGFVVLHSTTKDGTVSKIVPQLAAGDVVTTLKNTVDKVVTEWGVAELRARSIRSRAAALIAIAHPDHRNRLTAMAHQIGYL